MFGKSKAEKAHIKNEQLRHLAQSVRLEETVSPAVVRMTIFIICIAIGVFIIWASQTTIEEIARAEGDIIPRGKPKVVQHLEGGIISQINVRDGHIVEKDDLLLVLSDVGAQQDLLRTQKKLLTLELQHERFRGELVDDGPDFSAFVDEHPELVKEQMALFEGAVGAENEEREVLVEQIQQKSHAINALQAQVGTTKNNLDIVNDLYTKRKDLMEKGVLSEVRFLETKQNLNELKGRMANLENQMVSAKSSLKEFEGRLETLDAKNLDEDQQQLEQNRQELLETREVLESLQDRVDRLQIYAPVRGVVKGMHVNTVGAVVQPGELLLEILPMDAALVAQIKIQPDSIGYVKKGQRVKIKVSTFDFSRYGTVGGVLEHISATTFEDFDGSRFYRGRVVLDHTYVGGNPEREITPGMVIIADIITGKKTIMQYLLKPITVSLQTAFTER